MTWRVLLFVVATMSAITAGVSPQRAGTAVPAPTQAVRFTPPASLPDFVVAGTCTASEVAAFRTDAFRCAAKSTTYDPCFATARTNRAWCGTDPRKPESWFLVEALLPANHMPIGTPTGHRVWFFELTDGSTCQPLPERGREIEGAVEIYRCQFGSAGLADAVLGDLDSTEPIWTVRKVLINKKTEPQTIKSLTIAAVKTVWQ